MKEIITFVGLDVHKTSISVAVADGGVRKEARYFGKVARAFSELTESFWDSHGIGFLIQGVGW